MIAPTWTVRITALAVVVLVSAGCNSSGSDAIAQRRAEVEARGETVMPFDQRATTHVFRATAFGGEQRVVANDAGDRTQIRLVRAHLEQEAARFAAGDFADPMAIHGEQMPGLEVLRPRAGDVQVTYSSLPDGARIVYRSADARVVDALHDWFDAQLMDHGEHARG